MRKGPIFLIIALTIFNTVNGDTQDQFYSWWSDFHKQGGIPEELKEMEDHFVHSDLISSCSELLHSYNKLKIEQITYYGYQNFKQTVT